MSDWQTISLRHQPEKLETFCNYFSARWGKAEIYRNCMESALTADSPLPQWFLLQYKDSIIGCCGLITNDFISRMDLYPWLCALYVEEKFRSQGWGGKLIGHVSNIALSLGYKNIYCCTDHIGYYEKYGFEYVGTGYHPWSETSRIYCRCLEMTEKEIWKILYDRARAVQCDRKLSPLMEAGSVGAAILTDKGNIYTGICIDTACSMGMCAERNAIANMLTNGESKITKVAAVMPDGSSGTPCGVCREFMMQLGPESGEIEILLSLEPLETVKLKNQLPDWWGEKI